MNRDIRVGAVNYLNSKPLVEGLSDFCADIQLTFDLPSRIADQLSRGELDIGLIPVIEYFRAGSYSIIPNISIASRGPVLSVTLFSRVPWRQIRSVSLDDGSRTSAALTKILLEKRYGIHPVYVQLPLETSAENVPTDAVLLIGDRAMKACLPGYEFAYDLGQEWTDWTGLPFVYAIWAVRDGFDRSDFENAFLQAKRTGIARAGLIAAREAPHLGLDSGYCRRYLTHIIHYDLGASELAGLKRYYEFATELGLAPPGVSLEQQHREDLVESR